MALEDDHLFVVFDVRLGNVNDVDARVLRVEAGDFADVAFVVLVASDLQVKDLLVLLVEIKVVELDHWYLVMRFQLDDRKAVFAVERQISAVGIKLHVADARQLPLLREGHERLLVVLDLLKHAVDGVRTLKVVDVELADFSPEHDKILAMRRKHNHVLPRVLEKHLVSDLGAPALHLDELNAAGGVEVVGEAARANERGRLAEATVFLSLPVLYLRLAILSSLRNHILNLLQNDCWILRENRGALWIVARNAERDSKVVDEPLHVAHEVR